MSRVLLFVVSIFFFVGCGNDYQAMLNTPVGQCQTGQNKAIYGRNTAVNKELTDINGSFPKIKLRTLSVDDKFMDRAGVALVYTTRQNYEDGFRNVMFKPTLERYLATINSRADAGKTLYLDVKLESLRLEGIKDSNIYMCNNNNAAHISVLYTIYDENNNNIWSKKIQNWGVNYVTQPGYSNTWFLTYTYSAYIENPIIFFNSFPAESKAIVAALYKSNTNTKTAVSDKKIDGKKIKEPDKKHIQQTHKATADSLMEVGPQNLTVGDIKSMIGLRIGEPIIMSKIKKVKSGYKDFSVEEIGRLKSWGFTENVIAAMLDATSSTEAEVKQAKKAPQQTTPTVVQQQTNYQQTYQQPSVGDKVMEKVTEKAVEKVGEMIFKRLF